MWLNIRATDQVKWLSSWREVYLSAGLGISKRKCNKILNSLLQNKADEMLMRFYKNIQLTVK